MARETAAQKKAKLAQGELIKHIRELVAEADRPMRLDELVSGTGASVAALEEAFDAIATDTQRSLDDVKREILVADDWDAEVAPHDPVTVTGYGADGEAADSKVTPIRKAPAKQPTLPGIKAGVPRWGFYQGLKIGKAVGGFGGAELPNDLAEYDLDIGHRVTLCFDLEVTGDTHKEDGRTKEDGTAKSVYRAIAFRTLRVYLPGSEFDPRSPAYVEPPEDAETDDDGNTGSWQEAAGIDARALCENYVETEGDSDLELAGCQHPLGQHNVTGCTHAGCACLRVVGE